MAQTLALKTHLRGALDTVPGKLWLRQVLIAVVVIVLGTDCYFSHAFMQRVAQTVGKDAVPSIVAAENIRTQLAYAHTQLANAFLNKEAADGPSMREYGKAMGRVHDSLLSAAQNITYGDDERVPILDAMTSLAAYERLVGGLLQTGPGDAARLQADLLRADDVMRTRVMAAATRLNGANFSHLDADYTDFKHRAGSQFEHILPLALLLCVLLAECQWFLFRRFNRVVNPALAAGSLIFLVSLVSFVVQSSTEMESVRRAKEDAFDSVNALTQLRSAAYDANAQESIYLLMNGNAAAQAAQTRLFRDTANRIWSGPTTSAPSTQSPGGQSVAELQSLKGKGFIGDELANITFPGEREAATKTLDTWRTYVGIDGQIRGLEAQGQHAQAVALCLGTHANESDWAFERFDAGLTDVMKINQDAFDASSADAFAQARSMIYWLLAMLLAPFLGSIFGLQQRLAEFRQ
jgi:hypothetical protein